jgi:hypothetical protein
MRDEPRVCWSCCWMALVAVTQALVAVMQAVVAVMWQSMEVDSSKGRHQLHITGSSAAT